jgi:Cu/Ag efflux protein CusF
MRTSFAVLCAALFAAVPSFAFAQNPHAQHMAPAPAKAAETSSMTSGLVKKVDAGKGTMTIAHEEIKNLEMPKMTMVFRAKDPAWLKKIKEGDRIRFAADNVNGELTVVAYETAK